MGEIETKASTASVTGRSRFIGISKQTSKGIPNDDRSCEDLKYQIREITVKFLRERFFLIF